MPPSAITTTGSSSSTPLPPAPTPTTTIPSSTQPKRISKTHLPLILNAAKTGLYIDASRSSTRSIAWSPSGTLIATGNAGGGLRVWSPEKGENVRFSTELRSMGVSPSPAETGNANSAAAQGQGPGATGNASASGGAVKSAQGRTSTAQQGAGWGHQRDVAAVAFNPAREAELASLGADGVVRVWDVRGRKLGREVRVSGEGLGLCWRPDGGEVLVSTKNDTIIPIDVRTMTPVASYQQNIRTNQIAFSWSGKDLLLTTGDGSVKMLDYPSMQQYHTLNAHTSSCLSIQVCPRGRYIAVGGSDALISLWDTTDLVCQRTLTDMIGPVKSLSFSFDGSFIVGGSDEGTGLDIAHVETGEYIHKIETSNPVPHVAWHPSKYWLAYAGETGGLRIVGAPVV